MEAVVDTKINKGAKDRATSGMDILDLFCYRNKYLLFNFTLRALQARYRDSVLGFLWTLLIPLAQVLVYYVVFKLIFNAKTPNYVAYIVTGTLPWYFFSSAVMDSMVALTSNVDLISKVPIPVQLLSLSATISSFLNFMLALPVIFITLVLSGLYPHWGYLYLPLYLLLVLVLSYGIGAVLSIGSIYFRDLGHVMKIIVQLWFYATPVLYEVSMVPEKLRILFDLNPIAHFFIGFREIVFYGNPPEVRGLLVLTSWALGSIFLAYFVVLTKGRRVKELL